MRNLLILGGGTAGTMVANKLRGRLGADEWRITVVDRDDEHHYQPGYLFVPFGTYSRKQVVRSRHAFITDGVELLTGDIDRVDAAQQQVFLADGRQLPYDQLVIATGCTPRPEETPGMGGDELGRTVHEFYTLEGSEALARALRHFEGGKLVMHITDLPIKCPVAPLEFVFLADAWLRRHGRRSATQITYVTPLDGAFTKPVASRELAGSLSARGIELVTDFMIERVDTERKAIVSYDEREVPYDLLVTVPLNMGADYIARSGLGDDLNFVPCDHHTMLADGYDNIFVLGDAGTLPTSKAGSVAHFSVDVFTENFEDHIAGRPLRHSFDGHSNCFIESGDGKAMLLDFNYQTEPFTGTFPFPKVGPLKLLAESRLNHWSKMAFRWVYWHMLLPGRLPLPAAMMKLGKNIETEGSTSSVSPVPASLAVSPAPVVVAPSPSTSPPVVPTGLDDRPAPATAPAVAGPSAVNGGDTPAGDAPIIPTF